MRKSGIMEQTQQQERQSSLERQILMKPKQSGNLWTDAEIGRLKTLAEVNTPTPLIAARLGRTVEAVRAKAAEEGISLKPKDQK